MEVAQHPYKTQILDFHSCKTQWATRSLYFEGQKRNQFCILHYRLNLELLTPNDLDSNSVSITRAYQTVS
ncbi:hypothetical protein [Microcystis viridis]|uniref:hypothetical protein n=1 Tax=Microcystis viridis TaxID=44822 RepID=UPI0013DDE999|nr:hypothetical protein [Microcystis viridis]